MGAVLAFVAGAVNAGGFLLVGHYTSHMSGILSAVAETAALGAAGLAAGGAVAVLCFLLGAALSAILINWGRRHAPRQAAALPLFLEAALLLLVGALGGWMGTAPAMLGLCFAMGLQNATVTKLSGARIRTTHMTGVVTDLGIELGKLGYRNRPGTPPVRADRARMRLLATILAGFVAGGVAGALGFLRLGFLSLLPLCLPLVLLGVAMIRAEAGPFPAAAAGQAAGGR